ncbi:MAG: peptidyl-prolyl cis-trans isomerase [Bacteroidales bacterium]|nr:peptidyl-prolyl cis-trans isomerase [Bacteroidales bacterium]
MKKIGVLIGIAFLLLLTGCDYFQKSSKEVVVAECYGKYLYESDLKGIIPEGTSIMDSIQYASTFIDSWIRREVLIHQAESNLNMEELDLKKQLDEYRNSLVIYAYETQLINQKLDTVLSEDEIAEYYEQHKEDFQLRNTMVRVAYVIIPEDSKQKATFQKLMSDPDTLLLQNIDVLAMYYAAKSYLDVDHWMRLDELTNIVPIEIFNAESFLKKNKFVCFDMNEHTYMVRFVEYLLEESTSPLEMVRDNIKSVILAQRKQAMLERMKTALYEKAKRDRAFEVYVGSPTLYNEE